MKRPLAHSQLWQDYLLSVGEEEESGFFGKWHRLFEDSFFGTAVYSTNCATKCSDCLAYLPTERYLIHGDYGFNNVLADEGRVTAVLDWANAKFGDFLFDVAYLTNAGQANYITEFEHYYHTQNSRHPSLL